MNNKPLINPPDPFMLKAISLITKPSIELDKPNANNLIYDNTSPKKPVMLRYIVKKPMANLFKIGLSGSVNNNIITRPIILAIHKYKELRKISRYANVMYNIKDIIQPNHPIVGIE
jgi:hypothetical protein